MSRIKILSREEVPEASQPVLEKVGKMLGFVPNLHRLMAISPPALTGWAGLMGSLSTTLDVKTRDGIALAVSEADGCNYCLAAHSYSARNLAKVDENEIAINREGRSADPKRQAAIMFAKRLIETAGKVSDEEFEAVRKAGWSDAPDCACENRGSRRCSCVTSLAPKSRWRNANKFSKHPVQLGCIVKPCRERYVGNR